MGYLLKTKIQNNVIVKLFYSKPEHGYYASNVMALSREDYDILFSDEFDEYVFMDGWCDVSAELFSVEALGIDITDTFYLDCILQGNEIPFDEPIKFEIK